MKNNELILKIKLEFDSNSKNMVIAPMSEKQEFPSPHNDNELLTNEEVAKIMKLSAQRIVQLRSQGKFPVWTYIKLDGVGYRFKKKELLKFLNLIENTK